MRYLINNSTDPYFNMALDEYLLSQYPSGETFFYLWRNRPSVIIGRNQAARAEVNLGYLEENDILLARRVTGGGAVYHDLENLNYSIISHARAAEEVPAAVGLIVDALRGFGVPAAQGGRNDIFVEGRKVSGYARSVRGDRELVHGTLMYNVDIDTLTRALDVPGSKLNLKGVASVRSRVTNLRDYLPFSSLDDFQEALFARLSGGDAEIVLAEADLEAVAALRQAKFASPRWILEGEI